MHFSPLPYVLHVPPISSLLLSPRCKCIYPTVSVWAGNFCTVSTVNKQTVLTPSLTAHNSRESKATIPVDAAAAIPSYFRTSWLLTCMTNTFPSFNRYFSSGLLWNTFCALVWTLPNVLSSNLNSAVKMFL